MLTRYDLCPWIVDPLRRAGGHATIIEVARDIWQHHSADPEASGDLFYTWQYEMRWAAKKLRDDRRLRDRAKGVWEIV